MNYQHRLILVAVVLADMLVWVVRWLHWSITAIMDFWVTSGMMGLDTYLAGYSGDGLCI